MSEKIDDSGPFHPTFVSVGGTQVRESAGISMRDWFAGQALMGLLAEPDDTVCKSRDAEGIQKEQRQFAKNMAEAAYFFADAMIAERNKST